MRSMVKKDYAIVVLSDMHAGCRLAVCPPVVGLDGGGSYQASVVQKKLYAWFEDFFKWARSVAGSRPIILVNNGDSMEGVHHGTNSTISNNLSDQQEIILINSLS